ncbi:MAG: PaaI family thioesterase [Firmicutes bacterium]|nr:PaaI family thioesterase [Bacillota bacterium]
MAAFDWPDNVCFVCGSQGSGLQVRFSGNRDGVRAETVIGAPYQGFRGVVHGGILAGLVDDAMWHVIHQQDNAFPMTAELTVRYLAPVAIGEPLVIEGRLVSYRPRLMVAEATVANQQGEVLVRAEGRFMPPREVRDRATREPGARPAAKGGEQSAP